MKILNFNSICEVMPRVAAITTRQIRKGVYRLGIVPDKNGKAIQALKNSHQGMRAFIIGNGPSLQTEDLSLLSNEITFGSNKIYLAFDKTAWRPTYYSVCDKLVAKNNHEKIKDLGLTMLLSDQVQEYFPGAKDIIWIHESARNLPIQRYLDGVGKRIDGFFSHEILQGFDGGWSVIYMQMQLAFYMGITEVYLLGVDFSFSVPDKRVETGVRGYGVQIESVGEVNHFHPEYRKAGETWGIPRLDCQRYAFNVANNHYKAAGRTIMNASRATKLDLFDRVDFNKILSRSVL